VDPVAGAVGVSVGGAAEIAAKKAEGLLKVLLGPAVNELAGMWKDKIALRRHQNLVDIVVAAKTKLDDAGVSPREVPLKIIHPLLEGCSLEDDPDLQKQWSGLLASCADPVTAEGVLPSFSGMLKELSARDAQFLNGIYDVVAKVRDQRRQEGLFDLHARLGIRFDPQSVDLGDKARLAHIYFWSVGKEPPPSVGSSSSVPLPPDFTVSLNNLQRLFLLDYRTDLNSDAFLQCIQEMVASNPNQPTGEAMRRFLKSLKDTAAERQYYITEQVLGSSNRVRVRLAYPMSLDGKLGKEKGTRLDWRAYVVTDG